MIAVLLVLLLAGGASGAMHDAPEPAFSTHLGDK